MHHPSLLLSVIVFTLCGMLTLLRADTAKTGAPPDDWSGLKAEATTLEELLAVRLHLDDCDETNGPLRVAPGSHRNGILKSTEIRRQIRQQVDDRLSSTC